MTEEESQKQRANMRAINIRICHNDDFVIADFLHIHISIPDPCANRCDQGANLS